jgi:CheY-like chemotaxis protein
MTGSVPRAARVAPTLLLADDSATIHRVIELTFADEDVNVVAVSDGEEAIALLERTPPDIVLADVGMPGRSGYEVARHIKDTPRLAHIPVVLLAGAFEPIDQARAAAAGCDGVLAKPFEPQMVIGRVRELLSKPRAASVESPPAPPIATSTWSVSDVHGGADFEKLHQALANLSARRRGDLPPPGATALDWYTSQDTPATPTADGPLPSPPPPPVAIAPAESTPARPPLPPLVDAFAALLAAEQASPPPAAEPLRPSLLASPTATAVSDEVVEAIVHRVLDRLTDRVVRESVDERVGQIAERLVREEIERIKRSIT